jgi:WD repeat-containing protein 24
MYNKDKIMRKLLGKAAVESSPSSSLADHSTNLGVTSAPFTPATILRPSVSQDASYNAGVPIDCIDRSPDGHSAILAGRHILKTVKLNGNTVQDGIDIRAAILAQPFMKNSVNSSSDQLSIKDVKWLRGRGDTTIFTACASGKIFQYDLTRLGGGADGAPMEVIQMREDSRQINTLDINPRSSYLLAGSQDGIVRCFDIMNPVRTHTGHLSFRAVQAFKCNAGGVQCIQWSPHADGAWSFACGTEHGVVLKWDIRKATAPVLRINAHDKACSTIAWHPDGDHLVSGGWDNKCHVWDASAKADKRQKPKWTINTPAPVSDVAWRPGTWSATAQGKRAAQLAVTYEGAGRNGINACHVWDLARPTMPFKEVSKFDTSPSALLWHDQDLLWTCGQDGLFNQFDIAYARKVVDRTTMSVLAFSSRGDVVSFLDERPQVRRPHRSVVSAEMLPSRVSYTSGPSVPMLSISRSDSEDEVAGNFLGARRAKPKQRRAPTTSRSVQALSTTPPGGPDTPVMALEQSIKVSGIFKSQQAMTIGRAPAAANVNVYEYLSTHYLETLHDLLPYKPGAESLDLRIQAIMDHYSKAAETVGQFRLSQVWKILAFAMKLLLQRRAQHHLDRRTGELERSNKATAKLLSKPPATLKGIDEIPKLGQVQLVQSGLAEPEAAFGSGPKPPASVERSSHLRSLLSEELESTSQTTTPLARPVDCENQGGTGPVDQIRELDDHHFEYGKKLTPVQEGGSFTLPPPVKRPAQRQRLDSEPLSTFSHDSDTYASTEGYDFYDTDAISQAIDVPGAKTKSDQGPALGTPSSARRVVTRHDSDESFGHIFSISSGSRQTSGLTGSSSGSVHRRTHRITGVAPSNPQLARSASTGEYESRIRGARLESTAPPKLQHQNSAPGQPNENNVTQSTDDDHMITQTTMDSIESGKGESHPRPDSYPKYTSQTASLGVSPLDSFEFQDLEQPQETDYLPWSDDPRYPHPIAWGDDAPSRRSLLDPYKVVSRALKFETSKSALNASAMVLLLQPLVSDVDDAIDVFQAAAIIKQQHSRLMGMKLFTPAALLRKLCVKGWPGGPLQQWGESYPAVFRPAQSNNKAALLCQTCHKPREVDRRNIETVGANQIWRCERCSSLMAGCAICLHRDVPEPSMEAAEISPDLLRTAADGQGDGALLATWWYCHGCGHGGHASCLAGWHIEVSEDENSSFDDGPEGLYSDGCCPFDGCGHACLPGKYRAENNVARTEEVSRVVREVNRNASHASGTASPRFGTGRYSTGALDELAQRASSRRRTGESSLESSIHDLNEVPQSKAVESVRDSLASGHASPMGGLGSRAASAIHLGPSSDRPSTSTASILSSSPGRGGGISGDRERRKSVKFAGSATVVSADDGAPRRQ